ncbi:dihydroorotate dehydrogenase [Thermosulfuriphilus sp.]
MIDLSVSLAGLELKNPVILASGTWGYGEEISRFLDLSTFGAVVTKGISLEPRPGNPPPRLVETPCGLINAIGLENPGLEVFCQRVIPYLRNFGIPIVANIFGETPQEYVALTHALSPLVEAIEVNVSCPNVKRGGLLFGADPEGLAQLTAEVVAAASVPVIVKLPPQTIGIAALAQAAEAAGAQAISLINTVPAMAVDIHRRCSRLGILSGGLSGPAIKPLALRLVYEVCQAVKIPVIGIGGICKAEDVIEFMLVGASAIQVGTANLLSPTAGQSIIESLPSVLKGLEEEKISAIIGTLSPEGGNVAEDLRGQPSPA